MSTLTYKIEFFTYWHVGSGLSAGTNANSVVLKNDQGLPVIPGKTLKGLLREAAVKLNSLSSEKVSQAFIDTVFGIGADRVGKDADSKPGRCFFTNAGLSARVSEQVLTQNQQELLFANISSTAIDSNGVAKKHSLRTAEVTIPLTLYARIEDLPDEYLQQIEYCFQWVKRMGVNRNRGLGRCLLSIVQNQ